MPPPESNSDHPITVAAGTAARSRRRPRPETAIATVSAISPTHVRPAPTPYNTPDILDLQAILEEAAETREGSGDSRHERHPETPPARSTYSRQQRAGRTRANSAALKEKTANQSDGVTGSV